MPGPYITSVAQSIPFEPNRNPGFGGRPSNLVSQDVQNAIEEAKDIAISNDRFQIMCSTQGNAANGKYLEFFGGNASNEVPWLVPETVVLAQITVSAATPTSAVVRVYRNADLSTPIGESRLVNGQFAVTTLAIPYTLVMGERLSVRVEEGSISKPGVYLYFQNTQNP